MREQMVEQPQASTVGPWPAIFQTTVELQWLEHRWLVYHGCFELVLESLGNKSHSCIFSVIWGDFLFYYQKWYFVCTH